MHMKKSAGAHVSILVVRAGIAATFVYHTSARSKGAEMEWTFNYSIDDYREANRAIAQPTRPRSAARRETWVVIIVMIVMSITLVIVAGVSNTGLPNGLVQQSR